jgi:hypothetical protein
MQELEFNFKQNIRLGISADGNAPDGDLHTHQSKSLSGSFIL